MVKKLKSLNNRHLRRLPRDIKIVIGRKDFLLEKCKNKRVLHLGCVDEGLTEERLESSNLLHTQLLGVAKEVIGIDISEEGLNLLRKLKILNLIKGNVEQLDRVPDLLGKNFDIILATEIIEHLNNPGLFLQSAKKLFNEKTIMILTTPNAHRITGFSCRLKGFEYVHPDHNYWFSWSTMTALLRKNGYQIIDTQVYNYKDLQISIPYINIFKWRRIIKYLKSFCEIISRRLMYKLNPFFADGLIFIVKPSELLE
jgi:2-polyprenyl-3-methyl-5-hydroxy-6-metoxy-1,4-benzoquinol methylase